MLKSYKVMIAGGSILSIFSNQEINDIDIYFRDKQSLSDFLFQEMSGNWVIANTDKAFLFEYNGIKIQTIYFKYFNSPKQIFDTFDFTVCMAAFDFETEEFVLHKDFLKHNVSKILKFNSNTAYPIVSALRVDKYKKKGFSISKSEYLRIILSVLNLKIDTYEELKSQMGGMYGENYDNILEPPEGEKLDIGKIIDKLGSLSLEDTYFIESKNNKIDDWDEFVSQILDEKIKCFEYNNQYYRIALGEIQWITNLKDYYELVDISEVLKFPLTRYKYVRLCKDGTLRSFYDKSYVYKIGENFAKNSIHGLFAVTEDNLEHCSYADENDRVLIEIKIESINDVNRIQDLLDDTCQYKRVVVTRIVPNSEVQNMIKKADTVDEPFNN